MKLAVIGAGSTYTPELVSGLARERERSTCRARAARHRRGAAARSSAGSPADARARRASAARSTLTGDLDRALDGADFVLLQIRVGGQAARLSRRDRPARVRLHRPGDDRRGRLREGDAHGARRARDRRARRASSRPTAPGSSTSRTRSGSSRGRCSTRATARSASATSRSASSARSRGCSASSRERVVVDQVGLNHLTWVRAVRVDGDDVLPELIARPRRRAGRRHRACRARLLDELGARPVLLPALLLCARRGARRAARRRPRAAEVAEIERGLLELYRDPELTEKPALLEQRGGAFYSEAAVGLVALARGRRRRGPRGRRPERRHAPRARRRRRRRGARARHPPTGSSRCRRSRSRRSCSGWPSTSPPTSGSRRRRPRPATRRWHARLSSPIH